VLFVVATAIVDGAAALAETWVVGTSALLLSEAGGAWVLEVGEGAWIPIDSGLGGVAGGVGWAHALPHRSTRSNARTIFILIFFTSKPLL